MSSLLLLTRMLVVIGSTCPPTICTEFFFFWVRHLFLLQSTTRVITECDSFFITMYDKSYYKVRQLFSYKVRRMLLQSVAAFFYYRLRLYFIRKLRKDVMTKCNRYYKVRQLFIKKLRQFYYKVWQVLKNATGTIKCYVYFKVRQNNWPPSPHTISISRAQQSQPFETSQFHKSKESIGNITP